MTIEQENTRAPDTRLLLVSMILLFLAVTVLLWSEVGLKRLLPTGEVWSAYYTVSRQPQEVLFPSNWPNRPLRWIPHWIPYQLDTGSFLGYNIYIVTLYVLRGTGVYLLLKQLFKRRGFFIPIAATSLFMIYPAGTGWFSFRALTNQTATVIGFYGLWLLLLYWNHPRRWLWPFIWSVQVISLLMYEQMYGVYAVAPALFWWIGDRITLHRRFWRVTGLWYASLLPTTIYFYSAIRSDSTTGYIDRQMGVLEEKSLPEKIVDNVLTMYQEHVTAWGQQIGNTDLISRYVLVGLIIGLLVAGLSLFVLRYRIPAIKTKQSLILLFGSLVFMLVSFANYSFIADQSPERLRVYFVTTLGAAIIIAVLLDQMRKVLPDVDIVGLLVVLVTIGAVNVQQQLRMHAEEGMEIQRLVAPIVEQLHELDGQTTILVIDDGERFRDPLLYSRSLHLQLTLLSIYGTRPDAYICTVADSRDQCVFEEDRIELDRTRRLDDMVTSIPYDNLLIFRTLPGKKVEFLTEIPAAYYPSPDSLPYNPQNTVKTDVPLPEHIKSWFACWELERCDW